MSDEPTPGRRHDDRHENRYDDRHEDQHGDEAGEAWERYAGGARGAGSVGPEPSERSGLPESAESAELAVALRGLAQDHETPATVPGAEIRRRAVRRRRRRGAALAAVGTAGLGTLALVLAVVLTGEDTRPVPPAASHDARTPQATAAPSPVTVAATVDLARRELTVEGRTLPISAGTVKTPTPTGLMTVTAKYESAMLPGTVAGWDQYEVESTWVVRLRGPDDRTNYLLSLDWNEKAPGNYDSTGGAIGLRTADARWLYGLLSPGSVVEVVGPDPTRPAPARSDPARSDPTNPTPTRSPEDAATGAPPVRSTAVPGDGTDTGTGAGVGAVDTDGGVAADAGPVPSR